MAAHTSESALEGQRRQGTVLFADMADYTPTAEKLGEEATYTLMHRLIEHEGDVFLGVATHFLPPGGSRVEAMQINYARLLSLIEQAGSEANHKGVDADAP